MQITNFDEVIEKIKEHLKEYLEEQGINTLQPFSCLNPDHEDDHPSCGLVPGNLRWNCFSCGARGDIFDAANFLEKKPLTGNEFIQDTVGYLAKKYDIEVKERELAPEELRRIETYNAYKKASDYIAAHPSQAAKEEMKRRGWDPFVCAERGIGSVDSTNEFVKYLTEQGYSSKFLEDVDLNRPGLFNQNNLIFTVADEKGRPCGFAAKNLKYDPSDETSIKYVNSKNTDTDLKNNIYNKGKRLYNIHHTRKEIGQLWIMEGYADVETAVQAGLKSVVCIGGTGLTEHHLIELRKLGKVNVILALDGDKPGLTRTNKVLDIFSKHGEFRVHVILIPEELDPDDYIRKYGIEKFKGLKQYSAFEWKLGQYDDRVDPLIVSDEMIKIIACEPSSRIREEMAETLAKRVPYSKNAIISDVEKLINLEEREREKKRKIILDSLLLSISQYPSEWRININNAVADLESVEEDYGDDFFSPEAYIKDLQEIKAEGEENKTSIKGYNLGDWSLLQKAINGDQAATLNLVGGSPNTGKTAFMCSLAVRIAMNNENRNVMAIFQTIDDTLTQFSDRVICIEAQKVMPTITLNMIKNPYGFPETKRILEARNIAYERVQKFVADGRFIVRGGEQKNSNTVKFLHDWVKYCRKRYPDREIVAFLDNFHRLRDFVGMKDERARFKLLSNSIKDIAKEFGISIWATVEYTKAAGLLRPNNTDISESVAMEYDGNFIMHLYNELHAQRENASRWFESRDSYGNTIKMPTVEGIVGKNKITEFKGNLFWDFYPDQSRFQQISNITVEQREQARKLAA